MRVRHPRGDASHEGLEPPNVRPPRELAGERGPEELDVEASKLGMRRRVSVVFVVCVFTRVFTRVHQRVVHDVSGDERFELFPAVPREGARYRLGDERGTLASLSPVGAR